MDLYSRMQESLLSVNRIQEHFINVEENIQQSLIKVKQSQDELNAVQCQIKSNMMEFYHQQVKDSNQSTLSSSIKNTEPMSVKDAINFLRKSKVHLSDYGYYLCGSFEVRHEALKKAINVYPIEQIIQKLRALIIVWTQNTVDKIKSAEDYLNYLRTDFHILQEESLKSKHT
uniref:Uncharacterized protein n=1 Tax=viral metagenome TaxID=1070528 RepID=A0A6C0CS18_9ZZZZ